jgi:hypothetical protein
MKGRKKLPPKIKKKVFRFFVETGILDSISEEKQQDLKNQFINKLQLQLAKVGKLNIF